MSNGTTQGVSTQATWQSSNTAVATVSASGLVSAVGIGGADIRATYQTVNGSANLTVTASVFSVCGTVRATNNTPINGARIEILDGANAGKAVDSDAAGAYCIANVQPGSFTVRARKSDYTTQDQGVSVTANATLNFSLSLAASPNPSPNPNPTPNPNPPPNPNPVGMICNAAAYPSSASCGRPSAVCNNNSLSCSPSRSGTCSSNGGVKCWLCPGTLCNGFEGETLLDYTPVPLPLTSKR